MLKITFGNLQPVGGTFEATAQFVASYHCVAVFIAKVPERIPNVVGNRIHGAFELVKVTVRKVEDDFRLFPPVVHEPFERRFGRSKRQETKQQFHLSNAKEYGLFIAITVLFIAA